jgi:flagellar biosynthetic protein FliO
LRKAGPAPVDRTPRLKAAGCVTITAPLMLGRPPRASGPWLRPVLPAFVAAPGPLVMDRQQGGTNGLYQDDTKLPSAITHAHATGVHHVASSGDTIMRTGLGLVIVLAVIFGIYWLLKRYGTSKNGGKSDGKMNVLATTMLAPNRALHLVSIGDELVLVGTSEQTVTPIRTYSPEESAAIKARLDGGEPPPLRPANGFGGGWGGFVTEMRTKTVRK